MLYEAHDLERIFTRGVLPVAALAGISLQVNDGDFLAVTGPSGSGKTTLLHILGLLDREYGGHCAYAGREIAGLGPHGSARLRLAELGFVFQDFRLLDALSVLENVALPHWHLHGSHGSARRRATELLERLGLADRLLHDPRRLSGGEQQRVGLARALVNEPRVLLADEPTANLDADSTARIVELIADVWRGGRTVIVASHNPAVVAAAARTLPLAYGRLAERVGTEVGRV